MCITASPTETLWFRIHSAHGRRRRYQQTLASSHAPAGHYRTERSGQNAKNEYRHGSQLRSALAGMSTQMAKTEKAEPKASFRHKTSIGSNGQILYDCPLLVQSQADLDTYGISWQDCKTLNFHGSEKMTVFFFKTENLELAQYLWSQLDTQHSRAFANARCWILGKRKTWIRCPDTISCSRCPHKTDRKPPFISWDVLISNGYEPDGANPFSDEQIFAKLEYNEIKALMDALDDRIFRAFEMKILSGYTVDEIAAEFGISKARVYQLFYRGKAIAKAYRNSTQ